MEAFPLDVERIWPYVLPFPLEVDKRRAIWRVLMSRVGLDIIRNLKIDEKTYQKELISTLPFSNKSIIRLLKRMVDAGLLKEGLEFVDVDGRKVRVKWYVPTPLGRWLILFVRHPDEVPQSLAKSAVKELFQLYIPSVAEACRQLGLSLEDLSTSLNESLLREMIRESPKHKPRVVVYGCLALDIYGVLEEFPRLGEGVYVKSVRQMQGGMGANVAVALARLGVPVAFIARIGSDTAAAVALRNLIENGVDVSNVVVSDADTPKTLILMDREGRRKLLIVATESCALSPDRPEEASLAPLEECSLVYLGEVFVEVAEVIARTAKKLGKKLVYRPGGPYMRLGLERLRPVLENVDIFVMNELGWQALRKHTKEELTQPAQLLDYGPECIIITLGGRGCKVYQEGSEQEFPVPEELKRRFGLVDATAAGDSFTAGLIKGLLEGLSLEKAIKIGQVASSITCSRMGSSTSLPTLEEVEHAMNELGISLA